MPTRSVELTEELDRFVLTKVENGSYPDADEVIRAALRKLEIQDQDEEARLLTLRQALVEAQESGIAEGDPFERVRQTFQLRKTL